MRGVVRQLSTVILLRPGALVLWAVMLCAAQASAQQTVRSGSAANAAGLQAIVDQFRADLGGGVVLGPNGSFGGIRREINWDGVPDALAAPAAFPENFFNTTSPRGLVMSTNFNELRVSMDDDAGGDADPDLVRFGEIKPAYTAQFQTFSAQRLAGLLGTNDLVIRFRIPGTDTPAVVRGFGAVFTGVDGVDDDHFVSNVDYFDADGDLIAGVIVPPGALSFAGVSFPEARIATVVLHVGNLPLDNDGEVPGVSDAAALDDFIYGEPELRKYVLSEGATGFFDTDVVLANPVNAEAPVTLTFLKEDGSTIVADRVVPPLARMTLSLKNIPGLEAAPVSTVVLPQSGQPLGVERTMFWGANRYGGHTGSAVSSASKQWLFAEGSQGFFDTFVLVANQQDAPATVTFTFLRENETPVVKVRELGAHTRLSLNTGEFAELKGRSFGLIVDSTQSIIAERAMYFGSTPGQLWSGGHESPGVTAASYNWYFSEGAMGSFFDTFVLLMNPNDTATDVELTYRPEGGAPIVKHKLLGAKQRLTVNLEQEDALLAVGSAGTEIHADQPIVAERSMYWAGGDAQPWTEAHNSFGVRFPAFSWMLAEGRVGGPEQFHTYILLASTTDTPTTVRLTFLRENGLPVLKKDVNLTPNGRVTFDVSTEMPELQNESFSTVVRTWGGASFTVERSMYWSTKDVFWAGGSNTTGSLLPQTLFIP
jgi:hypothetical protein